MICMSLIYPVMIGWWMGIGKESGRGDILLLNILHAYHCIGVVLCVHEADDTFYAEDYTMFDYFQSEKHHPRFLTIFQILEPGILSPLSWE